MRLVFLTVLLGLGSLTAGLNDDIATREINVKVTNTDGDIIVTKEINVKRDVEKNDDDNKEPIEQLIEVDPNGEFLEKFDDEVPKITKDSKNGKGNKISNERAQKILKALAQNKENGNSKQRINKKRN